MPPKSYRPLPSGRSVATNAFLSHRERAALRSVPKKRQHRLNGIAGTASPLSSTQQPMDQVFLTGSHATKIISAAPFRPQCSDKCVSIPQGASSAEISFLEGALTKAGLLSAKR